MVKPHPSIVGAAFAGRTQSPIILRRTDTEFISAILNGLKTDEGRQSIAQSVAATRDTNKTLKLYQPVHQIFHLALVQAFCERFGSPRLDPIRIKSCGLVIRRVSTDTPGIMERWSKANDKIVGWIPCADDDLDPDPERRRPRVTSGNFDIDKRLPLPLPPYNGFTESVHSLFVAPPEVCSAAKATILYGVIPVTSTEKSEIPPSPVFDQDTVRRHLPYFLVPGGSRTISRPGESVSAADSEDSRLTAFVNALKQLKFEFDAFGSSAEGQAIFQALNSLDVTDAHGKKLQRLGDFLRSATDVLIDNREGHVLMPARWPAIGTDTGAAIATAVQKALETRLGSIVCGEGRYEDPQRQYRLRAFARIQRPDNCPPVLVWTDYSEPFTIAQWYESSGLPPVKVQLPDVDGDFLKNVKPNVAFAMPESLFNLLQKDAKKTLKGEDSNGGGFNLGLKWICGFSVPIITICAFIVLNIFLSLLNLFFMWLPFFKICIPIPVPRGKNAES